MTARYVDSHCHVDQYPRPTEVLKRAEQAGVITIAVTELPSSFQRLALRLGTRPMVRLALGIHPLRATVVTPMELALFTELLDETDYVGEVGLDNSRAGKPTFRAQVKIFEHLLSQPRVGRKVLTVHSRGAEEDTIRRLADADATAVLHWYSGPLKCIDSALAAGLWFSVNTAMLRSEKGQRILEALPRDRVVTETDGPYVTYHGQALEPRDIPTVITGLARAWGETPDEARTRVFANMTAIADAARS